MQFYLHKGHYVWPGQLPTPLQSLSTKPAKKDGKTIGHVMRASIGTYHNLRRLGMVVKCPTEAPDWHWVGQHEPMTHQRKTVASMVSHKRSFVTDDPGTGKTLSAIWGIDAMRKLSNRQRMLIVAPKSIVDGVWSNELFLHTDWRVGNLVGRTREKRVAMAKDSRFDVLLINPESLQSISDTVQVDGVVVDEFTAFKSVSAQRSKALAAMLKRLDPWTVLMSGTPAPQGPEDAYHPIKLINPRAARMTKRLWLDMTMIRVSEFTWIPRKTAEKTLIEWLQPGTRTSREEALDLPTIQTITRRYELTKPQQKAIRELRAEDRAQLQEGTITAANAAVAASKMLQTLTGRVQMFDERKQEQVEYTVDAATWFEAIQEIVDERHDPVLIFVPFRAAAKALSENLDCPVVMGDVKSDERQRIYQQINNKEVKAVVAVAKTMSHGLTLTGSNCVLWALPPVSAEQYQQANARVYRKGQTKPVDIIHLVGHNFVQALFTRTDSRVKLQQAVLDALAAI